MILAPHSFTSNKLKPPGNIENLVSRERNLLHRQPLIYTFFDDLDGKSIAGELLEAWETAWQDAGWKTRVLTMKEAEEHPMFTIMENMLNSTTLNKYEKVCFYRWLAMADAVPDEGGWMTDMDLFPLFISTEESFPLPHQGDFTLHDRHIPDLMSGSKAEWNRMIDLILRTWPSHTGLMSDMGVLKEIVDNYGEKIAHIVEIHQEVCPAFFYKSINKVNCELYHKNIKGVHFSHFSKKEAFLGGWLEADIMDLFGENTKLKIENLDGQAVNKTDDGKAYLNVKGEVNNFKFFIEDNDPLLMRQVYGVHRARLGLKFIKTILQQCT